MTIAGQATNFSKTSLYHFCGEGKYPQEVFATIRAGAGGGGGRGCIHPLAVADGRSWDHRPFRIPGAIPRRTLEQSPKACQFWGGAGSHARGWGRGLGRAGRGGEWWEQLAAGVVGSGPLCHRGPFFPPPPAAAVVSSA